MGVKRGRVQWSQQLFTREKGKTMANEHMQGMTRRSLLKLGALTGVAALGSSAFVGCAPTPSAGNDAAEATGECATSPDGGATLNFLKRPETITDFIDTKEYDVVVVGAGAGGVACALSALENGASVAVLQKEATAVSQGNYAGGILLDSSDPAGVEAVVSAYVASNHHSAKREIIEVWARNSGEAIKWLIERSTEAGAQVVDMGNAMSIAMTNVNGYSVNYVTAFFGPKPYNYGDGMVALANYAEQKGVEFFYNTPGVQLVTEEDGSVSGVIGEGAEGHICFKATKGVVLACGDFQNDEEMCNYFLPSVKYIDRKCINRTGDGHKMAYWAGAALDTVYSKMVHDMDGGPVPMMDQPFFLNVNQKGERFAPETIGMYVTNNYVNDEFNAGWYTQVFDSEYMNYADQFPGLIPPEALKAYMPEEDVERTGVLESFIGTYSADTLEELAEKLEIDPAAFVASVERYNELCAKGSDDDFGKPAATLVPVKTPPFYGIHRHVRLSCIDGGLVVDKNLQCLNAEGNPIKGLYAVGVLGAGSSGGDNWLGGAATGSTCVGGTALGRACTGGYVTGRMLAQM